MSIQQIIAFVLIASGALGLAGMKVWQWYKNRPVSTYVPPKAGSSVVGVLHPPAAVPSTDAPAPAGVGEYLTLIEKVAGSAPFQVWWGYAKDGLTEAAVLRAEVQRLTPKPPVPVKPVAPAEVKP